MVVLPPPLDVDPPDHLGKLVPAPAPAIAPPVPAPAPAPAIAPPVPAPATAEAPAGLTGLVGLLVILVFGLCVTISPGV